MSQIEAAIVREFVIGKSDDAFCTARPDAVRTTHSIECQVEASIPHAIHHSNPYYNMSAGRHESLVWGVDDDGFSFAYAVDLDALEEQDDRTFTIDQVIDGLGAIEARL